MIGRLSGIVADHRGRGADRCRRRQLRSHCSATGRLRPSRRGGAHRKPVGRSTGCSREPPPRRRAASSCSTSRRRPEGGLAVLDVLPPGELAAAVSRQTGRDRPGQRRRPQAGHPHRHRPKDADRRVMISAEPCRPRVPLAAPAGRRRPDGPRHQRGGPVGWWAGGDPPVGTLTSRSRRRCGNRPVAAWSPANRRFEVGPGAAPQTLTSSSASGRPGNLRIFIDAARAQARPSTTCCCSARRPRQVHAGADRRPASWGHFRTGPILPRPAASRSSQPEPRDVLFIDEVRAAGDRRGGISGGGDHAST